MNKIIFHGRLGRDPELTTTPKGTSVCSFSIANTRHWKGDDGEAREDTTWLDCTAFGRTAEAITKHHRKGDPLLIEGRIQQDNWEDKQTGQKRTRHKAVVEAFTFVKPFADDGQPRAGKPTPPPPRATATTTPATTAAFDDDDEIPF